MALPVPIVMKLRIISRSLQTSPAQTSTQIALKYGDTQFHLLPYTFHCTKFLETQEYSVALLGDLVPKSVKMYAGPVYGVGQPGSCPGRQLTTGALTSLK